MKADLIFKDEKEHYNINKELTLPSAKIAKCEYLTCGETLSST